MKNIFLLQVNTRTLCSSFDNEESNLVVSEATMRGEVITIFANIMLFAKVKLFFENL